MAVSVRTRFEVFKRDNFTCRYCGRKSPEVVLEVDHITPACNGGTDDPINLATSCWECNRGKAGILLSQAMTGEDPHDAAILALEKRRQLDEYNAVIRQDRERRIEEYKDLSDYWLTRTCKSYIRNQDDNWLFDVLKYIPIEVIRDAMDIAIKNHKTANFSYVYGIVRRWREEHMSNEEP